MTAPATRTDDELMAAYATGDAACFEALYQRHERGLYRFVRHPLYLSYVVAFAGYVINQPTAYNMIVYAVAVTLWVLRLVAEERFLMQDPAYREFAARTKWRLVPGVF